MKNENVYSYFNFDEISPVGGREGLTYDRQKNITINCDDGKEAVYVNTVFIRIS